MLPKDAQQRLTVVLVGARNPQNIGAAARAMQDFGFSDLRVVNDFAPPFDLAQTEATSAVGAAEVMRQARRFDALPEAIADCHLIAGTTAIGGRNLEQPVLPLRDAVPLLTSALAIASSQTGRPAPRVALLFGSEKSGLTREQLSHCSLLLTIPMHAPAGRHLSMNLGQSVAVCLYELTREGFEAARSLPVLNEPLATAADRERLLPLLQAAMARSGYARRFPANARIEVVRQLLNRLSTSRNEAATWMGLFRLILRHLPPASTSPEPASAPESA